MLNGRYLRSVKRLRNKRHKTLTIKLAPCQKGSRRYKRLMRRKAQASAKVYRQQRHILHAASARVMRFSLAHHVARIATGDVRDVATGVDKGRKTNQKVSQWPHGQFVRYLTDKARLHGITVTQIDESYSTRTCSCCRHILSAAPRGRIFRCSGCGATVHRDANGGAKICSRAVYGQYGRIQVTGITYRRATAVAPRTQARKTGKEQTSRPPVAARR